MAHGRSPLGMLRAFRASVFLLPLLALLALTPAFLGPGAPDTAISSQNLAEIGPVIRPLWFVAVAFVLGTRVLVSQNSPKPLRVMALCLSLLLVLLTNMGSMFYSLSGAGYGWTVAGYALAVLAANLLSFDKYAYDVSGRY
jgi:hypothetical protein